MNFLGLRFLLIELGIIKKFCFFYIGRVSTVSTRHKGPSGMVINPETKEEVEMGKFVRSNAYFSLQCQYIFK